MLSMCLVLILQFNFRFLISDARGEVGLITSYICLFWLVFGVLSCTRKLLTMASRGIFHTWGSRPLHMHGSYESKFQSSLL
jgi:hypothetical protein